MRSTCVRMLAVISTLLVAALFVSCGTDERVDDSLDSVLGASIGSQPLDPAIATLDEILDRARIVMGEVTSYKTRGTSLLERSIGSDFTSTHLTDEIREWQSPDRLYVRSEIAESGFRDAILNESINLSDRGYLRNNDGVWLQIESSLPSPWQESTYSAHVIVLDAPDMKLASRSEKTEEGTKVYRLEFTESPFLPFYEETQAESAAPGPIVNSPEFPGNIFTNVTSLLIDQQTFRILAQITDVTTEFIPRDQNPDRVDNAVVMSTFVSDERKHTVQTNYYYDYNVPNVIEQPTEYMTTSEANHLVPKSTGNNHLRCRKTCSLEAAPNPA
ncbi:MAG: hypothetical protein HQ477_03115 [Chloroflexi bacterium]|nr:hypothetical protein [Chloroflexota bacterium]